MKMKNNGNIVRSGA